MGSVTHVEDDKNELVRDLHILARLGVKFVDSKEGGIVVHNGSESFFLSGMKSKKYLDAILLLLKEMVLKKFVVVFSQGGDGVL
ncbi:hypothetical protein MTR67_035417 [Solanum verrucosum]|uniref:Uncharacterized protein n=1 Tax=Solanum verrucosum TaxID=315347 RepID=A0AAF0ZK96_SOLVR|nr:hypothetical protein MTR67_035417 [Solanum verrucosum]